MSLDSARQASVLYSWWPALAAWLSAGGCLSLAWWKLRSLARVTAPSRERLLSELTDNGATDKELGDVARRVAIAELNQRLADIDFELGLLPATFTALVRISLASGSALALIGFLSSADLLPFERAFRLALAALGGLCGAGAVSLLGRLAKTRAAQIRLDWDRSSRDIGKAFGTELAGSEKVRDKRFPV